MKRLIGVAGLRRDLALRLMLPMLALVAAAGLIGAYTAQRLVDQVFDRWLLDSVHSLAAQVRDVESRASIDLPPSAAAMLAFDEIDRTSFNVTQGERLIVGDAGLPDRGRREVSYPNGRAFDARIGEHDVRVAAVDLCATCPVRTTARVAETTLKRERARRDILGMLLPLLMLLGVAAVTIVFALQRTIVPLERIAAHWNEQSSVSLRPIGTDGVPRELLPFATALNQLLTRIRAMLMRERQFAATAAHQLRTPLAGLQLGLARAADAPDLATAHAVIVDLNAATQRTGRLIQQLLSLGRLDPEVRGDLSFEPTDLVVLAQAVGATYVELALMRSIALELSAPDQPLEVEVQPELIGEAIGNLVDNALRHTPPNGQIVIEFGRDPPSVRVDDSGPGLDPDIGPRAFERFVRGKNAGGEGSGLGLSIVREIMVLHGGDVEIGRSALGGASVTLRFASAAVGPPPR
ncbi:MAG: sensor histidine kinase N-terminal domain-containing protein [Caldimonas sp.]